MSAPIDAMLRDGNREFSGGMDSNVPPNFLARNQCAFATNRTFRRGVSSPRPAFVRRVLQFNSLDDQKAFTEGIFQHAAYFSGSGAPYLMNAISGRIWRTDVRTYRVQEVTPTIPETTTTGASFTIPAVGSMATLTVTDSTGMFLNSPQISVGGDPLTLISITDMTHVVVRNDNSLVGAVIPNGSTVNFQAIDRNSATLTQGWSTTAENYWIYQDNQSYPIIFDGGGSRRSDPKASQVPVGNVMAYAQGRLVVSLPDFQSFQVGDLVFGPSGTAGANFRDSVLYFTETQFLNEGGDFQARIYGAPSNYGPITAMVPVAMENTQLGQGPLFIFTPNVVFSLMLPFDRTTWKTLQSPLQTATPMRGALSSTSPVVVNTDVWYRSADGIRSYIIAQRDFQAEWGNTPQSSEVQFTLDFDTQPWLAFGYGGLWDNRLFQTISPLKTTQGMIHRGLAVVDFNLISKLTSESTPAWEGIWTGLKMFSIIPATVDHTDRMFIWSLSPANTIELWEMDDTRRFDDGGVSMVGTMDLPSYDFGDAFAFKKLETAEVFIEELEGSWQINVLYRSDQNPCWQPWYTFSGCALNQDCSVPGKPACNPPRNLKKQFRSKLKLPTPADIFDTINARKTRTGYEFQARLEITGAVDVKQFRIGALIEPEGSHIERLQV